MNANAALWTVGLVPCLFLAAAPRAAGRAARRRARRGRAAGGGRADGPEPRLGARRCRSRCAFFVAVCPGRVRLLAAIAAVGLGALLVSGPVLSVHDDYSRAGFDGLLADATRAILLMALVLAVVGTIAAVLDRRVEPGPVAQAPHRHGGRDRRRRRAAGRAGGVRDRGGKPDRGASPTPGTTSRAAARARRRARRASPDGGTNRYDFWTVAWEAFRATTRCAASASRTSRRSTCVRGSSERAAASTRTRSSWACSRRPASSARCCSSAALGAALAAALRGPRRASPGRGPLRPRPSRCSSTGSCTPPWTGSGSSPASPDPRSPRSGWPRRSPRGRHGPPRRPRRLVRTRQTRPARRHHRGSAAASRPRRRGSWASPCSSASRCRGSPRGRSTAPRGPGAPTRTAAFARLDRAERLNPLSARAPLTAATIALRLDDTEVAAREFRQALDREPAKQLRPARAGRARGGPAATVARVFYCCAEPMSCLPATFWSLVRLRGWNADDRSICNS